MRFIFREKNRFTGSTERHFATHIYCVGRGTFGYEKITYNNIINSCVYLSQYYKFKTAAREFELLRFSLSVAYDDTILPLQAGSIETRHGVDVRYILFKRTNVEPGRI